MSVGIPEIKQRYDIKVKSNDSLQDITIKMQLLGGEYKEKQRSALIICIQLFQIKVIMPDNIYKYRKWIYETLL